MGIILLSVIIIAAFCAIFRPPTVENIFFDPTPSTLNQPFTVSWEIGGNKLGATVDLLVDSRKIKTDLPIDGDYTFDQGLDKPSILTVKATNFLGLSGYKDEPIGNLKKKRRFIALSPPR